MKFAVIQFGGSNCDLDTYHVLQDICGVDTDLIWYKERLSRDYDAVVVPGGFSYGDYLRAGSIAARTAIMDDVERHVRENRLFLGICNGAQIGAERGFAPGMFTINAYPKFICRWVHVRVENNVSPFTCLYRKGEVVKIPIAHKEGRYVAPREILETLNRQHQVAFRFCDEAGNITEASNINGSAENITGILNTRGNVLLMMPHPERSSEEILGSTEGVRVFMSMIAYIEENA